MRKNGQVTVGCRNALGIGCEVFLTRMAGKKFAVVCPERMPSHFGFLCGYPISAVCLGLLRRRLRWLVPRRGICSCLPWLALSGCGQACPTLPLVAGCQQVLVSSAVIPSLRCEIHGGGIRWAIESTWVGCRFHSAFFSPGFDFGVEPEGEQGNQGGDEEKHGSAQGPGGLEHGER
jgi:hypothetical protein